jgi:ADP-ribosylglycohydrolase
MEMAMSGSTSRSSKSFRASETEQASIRALKNWLLSAPPENALEDQIVRQRLAAAIATLSEAQDWSDAPVPAANPTDGTDKTG